MATFKIAHFWSNLIAGGYQHTLPLYHAFVIDMVLTIAHGIPASSESRFIHEVNKASSEQDGDGDSMRTEGRKPKGLQDQGPRTKGIQPLG